MRLTPLFEVAGGEVQLEDESSQVPQDIDFIVQKLKQGGIRRGSMDDFEVTRILPCYNCEQSEMFTTSVKNN